MVERGHVLAIEMQYSNTPTLHHSGVHPTAVSPVLVADFDPASNPTAVGPLLVVDDC
jgi:hypothetical protein